MEQGLGRCKKVIHLDVITLCFKFDDVCHVECALPVMPMTQHKGLFQVKSNNLLKSSFIPSNQNYQTPKEMV